MRNLHLLRQISAKIELPGYSIVCAAIDSENQILYVSTDANGLIGVEISTGVVRTRPSKSRLGNSPLPRLLCSLAGHLQCLSLTLVVLCHCALF